MSMAAAASTSTSDRPPRLARPEPLDSETSEDRCARDDTEGGAEPGDRARCRLLRVARPGLQRGRADHHEEADDDQRDAHRGEGAVDGATVSAHPGVEPARSVLPTAA